MIKSYKDSKCEIIRATEKPLELICSISSVCLHKDMSNKINETLPKKLLDMKHTSVFEHVSYTFLLSGISRNCANQVVRHRLASYMSNSQHYQNYSGYNFIGNNIDESLIKKQLETYESLIKNGVPIYEARQILPGGMETNLIMTINSRSLINFLNQRLCRRNVPEMVEISEKIRSKAVSHFPELFNYVNKDCLMYRKCFQGTMRCDYGKKENK